MPTRRFRSLLLPGAVLAALAAAAPAHAADPDPSDQWLRWLGTPQEATVRSLDFIGPLLFAGTEGDGVFSSPTAVGLWSQNNGGLDTAGAKSVRQVKVAPNGMVYAATTDGLFRSAGGAGSWSEVGDGPGSHKLGMGGIQSVMFNGPTGTDITVAVAGAGGPGVYNSSDNGNTWDRGAGMPDGENVYSLSAGPLTVPMYAAADDGVFASVDFGRHWKLISDGIPPGETTLRVAVSPTDPADIYATTSSSVYVSHTGGIVWSDASGKDDARLPSGAKRALLLVPAAGGKFGENRLFVGTEQGVWGTLDGGDHWGQLSGSTFAPSAGTPMKDRVVWSLGLGFTTPVLMAGTQGFGVFNLPIMPIANGNPTLSASSGLKPGSVLGLSNDDPAAQKFMGFTGTRPYFFAFQWYRCSSSSVCTPSTPIAGATGRTFTVPADDAGTPNMRYAVKVTARNIVSPLPITVTSAATTAGVAALPGSEPKPASGLHLTQSPAGQPFLGSTFTVSPGSWRTEASAATIVPTQFKYQWQRCDLTCAVIPGATGSSYTAGPSDIGKHLSAYVSAVGPSPAFAPSDQFLADTTLSILNKFPVNKVLPKVVGNAYVGETLSSSAGGWDGFAMTYARRWFRCNADGLGCNPITFPSQTGSTYTTTKADLGSRLELELTAIASDPNQNRVTVAFSAQTAVVTDPPPPVVDAPAGGDTGGSTPGAGAGTGGGAQPGNGGGQQGPGNGPGQKTLTVPVNFPKKLKAGATVSVPKAVAGYKKVAYQWLRNGKAIKRATKRTYKLTRSDKGKSVSCRLTLTPSAGGTKVVITTTPVKVPGK